MLYAVGSPYYRQFLSSTINRKYQKNLEKQQNANNANTQPAVENKPATQS